MILAAPLVIPFSQAVPALAGLTGMLGMAALSEKVNEYIQENPEESMKILSTLVPNVGIGQIFMSKEDKISLEDLDEMTDEEAQDLTKEEKAELMKQAGKSGGKNKRQTMIDISEKLGLSGPGREKQDIEYEVDERYDEGGVEGAPRPQFDYKKFFRKRRADGGSIGIEVLFTEKKPRKNFNVGGSASIQDYADAVSKVSAGTTAQKLQNIGEYATNKLGLTQKHFDTIAAMKSDPKKFGIDKQIDYAKLSGKDLVKGANPALQPFVALGQGLASPIYDYYQALQKYSDKGYQGDFELSKKGIVDFGKNLLRVGEEFAAQKPIQMAAGRTLGGLEAIQEGLSQFGTAAAADTSKLKPLGDKERFRLGLFAANQVDEKTGDRLYDIDKMYDNYTKNFAASGGKGYFSSPDMLSRFKQFYADGGRVGLFMGGPALEGQALSIYNSMNAYGFTDQEIADTLSERGLRTPGGGGTETTAPNIIGSQLKSPSGGDNFSVFNPDPNRIKSFTPAKNIAAPSNLSVQGDYDIYGNKVKETLNPLQTGIRSVKNTMASVLDNPVFQTIGAFLNPPLAAAKGVVSLAKNALPVNQRALTENFAGQQGIRVDDIGRIVNTGKYTDPNNVMAGYNLNAITQETFDDRIGNIAETLADKYGMTPTEIQAAMEGTYTGPVKTNLIETIRAVNLAKTNIMNIKNLGIQAAKREQELRDIARANKISREEAQGVRDAIDRQGRESAPGRGDAGNPGGSSGAMSDANAGTFCFDPNTLIQMADGSEKKIKEIQLGDQTKGGEVTGVFQFKASDEIHDYKGVVVAGSHYVKEDGKFIMVQDSPISVKIDKIPVVYSLDTTGRRIFINDIEFADYNGDGVAKNFLTNAGVDLTGFDTEVLRQVENRLL